MSIAGRIGATTLAVSLGAGASQAPEFTQQYRQRLGGALDELARVIARFDTDAATEGLDRDRALQRYEGSGDDFLTRRGGSVRDDVERLEYLTAHAAELEATPPSVRPLLILRDGDGPLVRATLDIYEPALPLTASGATYGLSGVFAAMLAWWGGASMGRTAMRGGAAMRRRRRPRERSEPRFEEQASGQERDPSSLDAVHPADEANHDRRSQRVELVRRSRDMGRHPNHDPGRSAGPLPERTP